MNTYITRLMNDEKHLLDNVFGPRADAFKTLVETTLVGTTQEEYIFQYADLYRKFLTVMDTDGTLETLHENEHTVVWGDCLNYINRLPRNSVQLVVTSPPYYNAREYSVWKNLDMYLADMEKIIRGLYRVMENHRNIVWNVSDICSNDNLHKTSTWCKRKIPLPAYFITLFEKCGFTFIDDIIWDKGEVQSSRQKNDPYPMHVYPINCYEHILIFRKHELDKTPLPCTVCGSLKVSSNSQSSIGVQSWECKNPACFSRSPHNRGKRFSSRTVLKQNSWCNEANIVDKDVLKMWRRDIVKLSPVIKINSKKKNIIGHTAPYPEGIPEMAINFFSYKNDLVLDPFGGSCTTTIVAHRLGRHSVSCELRQDLFESAIHARLTHVNPIYQKN